MTPRAHRGVRGFLAGTLLATSLVARGARADDDQTIAAQFFQAGLAAYARHDYEAAARAFEEANRHSPRGEALFNVGLAWQAAGDAPRAADAYSAALAGGELTDENASKARGQLAALERALGVIHVTSPAGARATVGRVSGARIPVRVHVSPGEYDVRVSGDDGREGSAHVAVAAGATAEVSLLLPPQPSVPAPRAPPPEGPSGDGRSALRTWGWITLGASGVFAAASLLAGAEALAARDSFEQSGETSADDHDRAATLRTFANVGWVVTGALALTGVGLLVLPIGSSHGASRGRGAPLLLAGPLGVTLRGFY